MRRMTKMTKTMTAIYGIVSMQQSVKQPDVVCLGAKHAGKTWTHTAQRPFCCLVIRGSSAPLRRSGTGNRMVDAYTLRSRCRGGLPGPDGVPQECGTE